VPWYRTGAVWRANVPHEANEADFNSPDREDRQWEGLTGVTRLRVEADEPLGRLLDYTVRWYRESDRAEAEARALGLLIVNEVDRLRSASTSGQGERPEELTRLLALIERSFRDSPSVKELAVQAGRSRSHVLKLFRKHLGQSAKSYVLERQLREACELLLNTTMRVSEVGRAVGMADPYHFSKLFRRRVGLPPREYRARNGPFSTPPKPSIHQTAVPLAH
jgi:AraC-like DNA-binding protein